MSTTSPQITEIRDNRKVIAFRYRDVFVTRIEFDGVTWWQHQKHRFTGGQIDVLAKTKAEAVEQINKTLVPGRDWYGKPVVYVVLDGELIDARLAEEIKGGL